MKRQIIFLVLIVLSLQLLQAGGVGITPVYYKEFFEPGLTKTYPFHSFSSSSDEGIKLYIEGDLSEYVNLSTTYLPDSGSFTVTINLPDKIEIPGIHRIYVGATEARKINDTMVGGIAAIRGRIDILVPYPGEYSESTFKISNINEGERTPYELEIQNLGTQSLVVKPTIEIFKTDTTEPLLTKKLTETEMKTKETWSIIDKLDTQSLPPGGYQAFATIDWGKITTLNQTFRIGEFLIDIVDYDYQFEQGKINPFKIKIENKWNTKIEEVYATVLITDQGKLVGSFKTVSIDTNPWEIKDITGYFDTTTLEAKRYTAKIALSYGGATTSKLVAIYVNLPPAKKYQKYIIMTILIIILTIAAFIYLIWKVRKLEHKNEKKNKKKK